jgi:hypothetical protein
MGYRGLVEFSSSSSGARPTGLRNLALTRAILRRPDSFAQGCPFANKTGKRFAPH